MIKKIITVKNVGRLRDCSTSGDVELRRASVLFAENAAGKTTLCEIFRSLREGEPELVNGRRSVGSAAAPLIEILLDSGLARFENGAWSATFSDLEIFDSRFVNDNVYAGERIEHEHKKNLYRVIIGSQGVDLARRIEALDAEIRALNKQISEAEELVSRHKGLVMTLDDFLGLDEVQDVDKKIAAAEKDLMAVRRSAELQKKTIPSALEIPILPANMDVLLKTDEAVAADVEDNVKQHIAAHGATPQWLQQGVDLATGDSCPLCGQNLAASEVVPMLRAFFSESYRSLKTNIDGFHRDTEMFASDVYIERLKTAVERNGNVVQFWSEFVSAELPSIDVASVEASLIEARDLLKALAEEKRKQPLEAIKSAVVRRVAELTEAAVKPLESYNASVQIFCDSVAAMRTKLGTAKLADAEGSVTLLRAQRERHKPEVRTLCNDFRAKRQKKIDMEAEKRAARGRLDEYTATVFPQYERQINTLLKNFGASFEVHNAAGQQVGGTPSTTYALLIDAVSIPLTAPLGQPSFSNTLSAGDRSALALAFFLVKVFRDPNIGSKVVVFDDPFTSQDGMRRSCTQIEISKVAERAKQVIALSHDPSFLRGICETLRDQPVKTLQIAHFGAKSRISEWDVDEACREQYAKDHRAILDFVERGQGDVIAVRSRLRPLLESYLTMKLPDQFDDHTNLGTMISLIRNAAVGDPKDAAKSILAELEAINEYALAPHHGTRGSGPGNSEARELKAWAERTLQIVRGFPPFDQIAATSNADAVASSA